MMVAIPELDGATGPDRVRRPLRRRGSACTGCERAARSPIRDGGEMHVCSERADMLAARVAQAGRAAPLRARADRKVAIVLFNFPPNAGNTGTAAYLVGLRVAAQHADGA